MPAITKLVEYSIMVPQIVCPLGKGEQDRFDDYLAKIIIKAYGGFTKYTALKGAWCDAAGVVIYDTVDDYRIGIDESTPQMTIANVGAIRALAYLIGKDLGEKAMYIRLPQGHVEVLSMAHMPMVAHS